LASEVTTVNPKFGKRSWVKLWVNEWLDGTTRFEMSDIQRAFWIDLLALGGRSRYPGRICAGVTGDGSYVGYPLNKFQALMAEPIDVEETLALFVKTGKIVLTETASAPTKLVMIEIVNWDRYQSEYQRQKKYRYAPDETLQQSDSESYTQSNTTDTEGETETDTDERKKNTSAEPKRKLSPFEVFWGQLLESRVPKPMHKQAARKVFTKLVNSQAIFDRLLAARENYAGSKRVRDGYVQDASTWISDFEQWEKPEATPTKEAEAFDKEKFEAQLAEEEIARRKQRSEQYAKLRGQAQVWAHENGGIPVGDWSRSHEKFTQFVGVPPAVFGKLFKEFEDDYE
jgi:hypothetical protein